MPLNATGAKVLSKMQDKYGSKKGKGVFYGKENSDKKFARAMKKGAH